MPSTHVAVQVYERDAQRETLEGASILARTGTSTRGLVPPPRVAICFFWSVPATGNPPLQRLSLMPIRRTPAPAGCGRWFCVSAGLGVCAAGRKGCVTFGMDGQWEELKRDHELALKQFVLEPAKFPSSAGERHAPPALSARRPNAGCR